MKKILLLLTALAVYQNWFYLSGGYSDDNKVVLYTTDWCGYCKKARAFFEKHDIAFTEFDIEKSTEGRKRYEALGGQSIPLIVINNTSIRGFNQSYIQQVLK